MKVSISALTVVPEYMVEQNRPYSAIDVYNNLRQQYGKTVREMKGYGTFSNSLSVGSQGTRTRRFYRSTQGEIDIEAEDILC